MAHRLTLDFFFFSSKKCHQGEGGNRVMWLREQGYIYHTDFKIVFEMQAIPSQLPHEGGVFTP